MQELILSEAAERGELSKEHLARLLKSGAIKGRKKKTPVGEYWLVDVASLDQYVKTPHKPGRKKGWREAQKQQERQQEGALQHA